jgi:membrane-associated phospholipid phosphatase
MFTAILAAVTMVGLRGMHFALDADILVAPVGLAIVLLALAGVSRVLAQRRHSLQFVLCGFGDFVGSVGQLLLFLLVCAGLQNVAASANLPLADDAFRTIDASLGFDGARFEAWVRAHPALMWTLWACYSNLPAQFLVLFTVHAMRPSQGGSGELLWTVMIALVLAIALSVLVPVLGRPGMIGQHHIDALVSARQGTIVELDGLIQFPSFHAALGALFIYAARTMRPLLACLLPVNLLLIIGTSPCGGHYLVDTIAGVLAAIVSILLTRRILRPNTGTAALRMTAAAA